MIGSFQELRERVRSLPPRRAVVAGAASPVAVAAMETVRGLNGLEGILVGDAGKIESMVEPDRWEILHQPDPAEAARTAAGLVRRGEADLIVKGACGTAEFMKACLDPTDGLRGTGLMAQLFAFSTASSRGLRFLTDAAINIRPNRDERADLIQGAVPVLQALENPRPAVALLAALEKPNPRMPDTVEAAEIASWVERWDRLGCDVAGPLSIDCALDPEAAETKGLRGPVPGRAELLIFPDLAGANILAKGICLLGGAESGAIVTGGSAPIVLRSRADTVEEKVNSLLLGLMAAEAL